MRQQKQNAPAAGLGRLDKILVERASGRQNTPIWAVKIRCEASSYAGFALMASWIGIELRHLLSPVETDLLTTA
jgi:hypothetical protein